LLAGADQKGYTDALKNFLYDNEADIVLMSSLPPVMAKEPSERAGFDLHVISCLRDFLGEKVNGLNVEIEAEIPGQVDAHAEAVGAFAILDLARDHSREASAELRKAEAAVQAAREKLREATQAVKQQEAMVAEKRVQGHVAEDKARRCQETLELLKSLESGEQADDMDVVEEAPLIEEAMAPVPAVAERAASRISLSPAVLLQSARNLLSSPAVESQSSIPAAASDAL